ncbi:uncharacterized protein LOC141587900 [Silene latifolia]|uniref:uncharacterized protein LOC141587900 n=1 Tax=Silene latifolia TaxID=37657 RepID=UPI003D77D8FC
MTLNIGARNETPINILDYRRSPLVGWDTVCRPKEEEGLGLKDQEMWNKAMIGRLVDWVAEKRDSIWVHWVHNNYLKGQEWMEYSPTTNSSWIWRRICKVKEVMAAGYTDGKWEVQQDGYTPAGCYNWFKGNWPCVTWYKVIWNGWAIPKHQFLGWLIAHEALNTVARLKSFGLDIEDKCYLCGVDEETAGHLFFECTYSTRVIIELNRQTRWDFPMRNVVHWCEQRTGTKAQRGVQSAMMLSALYQVWKQRNKSKNEAVLVRPECVAKMIMDEMRSRVRGLERATLTQAERDWFIKMRLVE